MRRARVPLGLTGGGTLDGQAAEGDAGAESQLTTISQIKKLGREIDCEGILRALLQEGENMGKPENGCG